MSKEKFLALHKKAYLITDKDSPDAKTIRINAIELLYREACHAGLRAGIQYASEIPDQVRDDKQILSSTDLALARSDLAKCERIGARVVMHSDADYPIKNIPDYPPLIFMKGQMPDPKTNPYVAFVGARKATPYGIEMTRQLVRELRLYNVTIVSGLAYGIDSIAHQAALEYGLPTVAIIGCGIDYPYPADNLEMAKEIVKKGGAIISEFPLATPPLPHNFPIRNRIISGLSKGVVVVEAQIKSGSTITARWALDQGREVFAVPGTVHRAMSAGTNQLIKDGAHLVEYGKDIAEVLKFELKKNSGQDDDKNDIKRKIKDYLRSGRNDLENLSLETGLGAQELLVKITEEELEIA